MKTIIKKIIMWFKSLFSKKTISVKNIETAELSNKYEIIRITAGKCHAWVNSKYGIIRKPLTSL
jgi:hypothetical protein